MLTRTHRTRDGFILAWVLIVILVLITIGSGLATLATWEGVTVVRDVGALQAFNLAEAGINWGIWQLSKDNGWTGDTLPLDGEQATVTAEDLGDDWYAVTSQAVVSGQTRSVSLSVKVVETGGSWPGAITDYGIYWAGESDGGGDLEMQNHVAVNGPVYVNGAMEVTKHASVYNGTAYTSDEIYGKGSYTDAPPPDPGPEPVDLDTTWYDDQIQTAGDTGVGDRTFAGTTETNLSGYTLYVDGDVTIQDKAVLRGPGQVIASGNITVQSDGKVLGSMDLIAGGTVTLQNHAIVEGEGNTIYGGGGVVIQNLASVNPSTPEELASQGSSMVFAPSGEELEIKNLASVRGILWGGRLTLSNHAAITGTLYAEKFTGNEIENHVYVEYDPSVFDGVDLGEGIPSSSDEDVEVTIGVWSEGADEEA